MLVYKSLPWKRDALIEIPDSKEEKILVKTIPSCGYKTISLKDNNDIDNVEPADETTTENIFLNHLNAQGQYR